MNTHIKKTLLITIFPILLISLSSCDIPQFDDEYYDFAKKLKSCDALVIAAPFYDLCFPTILKCFIEQTLVYNLTFVDDEFGVKGIINCKKLIYLSVRGGVIND